MVYDFNYYTPTKVIFAKNAEDRTGEMLKEFGAKKVLVHYGTGSVVRSGLLKKVIDSIKECGISYVELGGAVPNPRLGLIREGIELCRKEGVDFILAVGGGSAVDSAKAIGYGVPDEGDVWDFYDNKRAPEKCLPIGVIMTIAATGSEMSNSSVITNEDGLRKRGINFDISRPKFALMNPSLTMTLPDYQTASGCVDIMMHTLERYFAGSDTLELTDEMSEALLRTVIKNALILRDDPKNYDARAEVLWAGSLSHNGLMQCGSSGGDWACHKIEHELGGMYDVAHGAGLAAVWASWARYVYKEDISRFERLADKVFGIKKNTPEETALAGITAMEDFFKLINMPTSLKELGISPTAGELDLLAKKCIEAMPTDHCGSFKKLYEKDVRKIYELAY